MKSQWVVPPQAQQFQPPLRSNVQAAGLSPVVRALVKLTQWQVLRNQLSFQLDRSDSEFLIPRSCLSKIQIYYKIGNIWFTRVDI